MLNQGDVIRVHSHNLNNNSKEGEYIILNRDEYNYSTGHVVGCENEYTPTLVSFLIPINQKGLRYNSKVNALISYQLSKKIKNMNAEKNWLSDVQNIFLKYSKPIH